MRRRRRSNFFFSAGVGATTGAGAAAVAAAAGVASPSGAAAGGRLGLGAHRQDALRGTLGAACGRCGRKPDLLTRPVGYCWQR